MSCNSKINIIFMTIQFGVTRMKAERHPMMRLIFTILLALLLDDKVNTVAQANIVIQINNDNDQVHNQDAVKKQELLRQIERLDQEQLEMNQQLLQVQQLQESLENQESDADKGGSTMLDIQAQRVIEQGQEQRQQKFSKQLKQLQSNNVNSHIATVNTGAKRGNPNEFFTKALKQQKQQPADDPDVSIDPSQQQQQQSPQQLQNIPKTIEVNMKLTDELKKKILESANSNNNQPRTFSMNIPIQDLANSTCNSTNCESIVDAATKAVTGDGGSAADNKEGEILNVTQELQRKAQPQKGIKEVPKKRVNKGSKTVIKAGKTQRADEDEGPQDVSSGAKDYERGADGVYRKDIKLNPVLPAVENTEPSDGANATEQAILNGSATDANATIDEKEKQNEHSTEQIKEIVRKETERMAKENNKKDELLKNLDKPTNSSSVEPASSGTNKQDKIKTTILKIKDYNTEQDLVKKPKVNKTESGAGAPPQGKKLEPSKTKKKDKTTTIKINKEGGTNQTDSGSQPADEQSPMQEKMAKPESANQTVAKPSESAAPKTTSPATPTAAPAPGQKKKTKKCVDVDEDEPQNNQTKVPAPKADDSSQTSPESASSDPSADQAESAPIPPAPAPPPSSATKEQKLKYLEDLEKNLQRTKDQVRKEKEKEEAKIKKQKDAGAKKDQQKEDSGTVKPAAEEAPGAPATPPAPAAEDAAKSSPPSGDLEAEAKAAEEQATKQVEEQFKPAADEQQKESEEQAKQPTVEEEVVKPVMKKIKQKPDIKKKVPAGKKAPVSPTSQKKKKQANQTNSWNLPPKKTAKKNTLKPTEPAATIKPEDIEITVKKEEQPKIKPEDIEIKVKKEEKAVKPEDIEIKIKKDGSNDKSTGVVSPDGAPATAPSVPTPVVESSADASSIVDQAMKQMEETKKIQELQKEIEKEKKEEAKAKAKKEAILKLIKPKNKDKKSQKKGKKKESTEAEKNEDIKKRMTIESVADEIQKINPVVKEDVVDQIEQEKLVPPTPIISKPIVAPKLKSRKVAPPAESADPAEAAKNDVSMKFTGDEDIDENLYFNTHNLNQMQKKHSLFAQQLSSKIEQDEQKRQQDLNEAIKSTKLMEKSNIQDQLDMQKKMQMTKEFKELQDEEDRQENEALKAQMELEIAQAQIQKKQLEQKKALIKARHASMMKEQHISKQDKLKKLEALRAAQTLQQEEVKKQEEAEEKQRQQEQMQKQQEEEQAIVQAQQVADDVQQKLAKQQQEEQERQLAEALQKEKEAQEKLAQQQAEEKARKERVTTLTQKNQPKYQTLVEQMKQSVNQFSLNQKMSHLQNALAAKQQIENDPEMQELSYQAPELKVHAVDVFKSSFTFPQIALNEFAQQQLETLQADEDKLNSNLNDNIALNQFIKTTHYVAQQLKQHYGKQWVNPNQDAVTQPMMAAAAPAGKKAAGATSAAAGNGNKAAASGVAQKESDATTNGLSLPKLYTSSHDFDPEQLSQDSEKEMQYDARDLKANAEVDQAMSQQLTPEEQEILNQSSIMTDEEQAKYQKLADGQDADSAESGAQALTEVDNNPVTSATKQISQMALTSQDLAGNTDQQEGTVQYRQLPSDSQQSQEQPQQQQQPIQETPQPKTNSKIQLATAVSKPALVVLNNIKPAPAKASVAPPIAESAPVLAAPGTNSQNSGVDQSASQQQNVASTTPETDFQAQDILGQIAAEDQTTGLASDIDEIVG